MKKNLFISLFWPFILLVIFSALIVWPLFQYGYFSHHDDLQVMRILEMRKCFEDGQIPCRWVPDLGWGNGFPLFNFYGVFPYYLGALSSYVLGYIGAAKLLFFLPLFLGPVFFYLFANELFQDKKSAFFASVLLMFAPYRALDTYVRGAIAESFAITIAPLVFYFSLKLAKRFTLGNLGLLSIAFAAFLTCHNIMTLFFVPVFMVWGIYLWGTYKFKNVLPVAAGFLLGFGMSAFFIIPSFFEKDLVTTEYLTRFELNFRAHFVTVPQLFLDRSWGYGASIPGPDDTISFQIGWPHAFMVLGVLGVLGILVLKKKLPKQLLQQLFQVEKAGKNSILLILFFILLFSVSVFMTHNKSAFVWEKIGLLRFAQFPWRFLSVTIIASSLLGGYLLTFLNEKLKYFVLVPLVALTIVLNFSYFQPEKYFQINDTQKLTGALWEEQRRAGILDYLPKQAPEPKEPAETKPLIVSGEAEILNFNNRSNYWEFKAQVDKASVIRVPVFNFPNWRVYINGQEKEQTKQYVFGRIGVELEPGIHTVSGRFFDTPLRSTANTISLISIGVLLVLIFIPYAKNLRKN